MSPHLSPQFSHSLSLWVINAVEGVEVLIVDTPWLTPLLMHICEIVFIGSMHFPGEQNYMVVAQAAVASCAVVASSSVMAHVQLAQELNNAAVNAAEDAAHAVRTAGVCTNLFCAAALQVHQPCPNDLECSCFWVYE